MNNVIGYLGPKGSFSHEAAYYARNLLLQNSALELQPIGPDISELIDKINNQIAYGVVPITNSLIGDINSGALTKGLQSVFEIELEVPMVYGGSTNPKTIYSKDSAFEQCTTFLKNLAFQRGLKPQDTTEMLIETLLGNGILGLTNSTSEAIQRAIDEPWNGAIGSEFGMRSYGLKKVYGTINDMVDEKQPTTTFAVFSVLQE